VLFSESRACFHPKTPFGDGLEEPLAIFDHRVALNRSHDLILRANGLHKKHDGK
jgi:hypothetical protein